MNISVLSENQKWLETQSVINYFSSQNQRRNEQFQEQFRQLNLYKIKQNKQLDEEFERFYLARTNAANIVKELLKFESDLIAAKDLDAYIFGLSPIYARLDYIEKLINKRHYQEAERELQVLDHRLSIIINEMTSKQAQIFYEYHNTGVAKP